MIYKTSMAAVGAAVLALGTVTVSIAPAKAATVTLDVSAQVSGNGFIDPGFASLVNSIFPSYSVPSGNFPFDETFSSPFTIDDNPQQYLDGDISVGLNFLSALGFDLNPTTLAQSNNFFGIAVSGDGTLSNGLENIAFNLSYNSNQQETIATFVNFDPQNNFIPSCLIGTCTTTGNFEVSLLATSSAQFILGLPKVPVLVGGNFLVTTTPQNNNNPTPPTDPTPPPTDPTQSVPEPTMLLGLLGTAGFFTTRRKCSR
jgi:hypothetical protein